MIVIVAGMHRSGTSAMAGMLHANGITMGDEKKKDFYPPPMRENPKGFYENVRFRRVNDAILKENGYRVKSFNPDIPDIPITKDANLRHKMKSLINEFYGSNDCWGWKDPRTNLTIQSWWDVMKDMHFTKKDVRIISLHRAAADIAHSMQVRGNKEKEIGQFEQLVHSYNFLLMENLQSMGDPFAHLPVTFNELIHNTTKVAADISELVGKEVSDTSFVDPAIAKTVA